MERLKMIVQKREATGKGGARKLRAQGLVPAICYGPKMGSIAVSCTLKELTRIIDDYAGGGRDFELFGMSYPEFREDILKLLGNLEHASGRISATVSVLGEFVRGSDKGKRRSIDLKQVMESGIAICRGQVEKTVKSFEVDIAEDLPRIFADSGSLEQVLVNLLINAAQAADKEDSWVRLGVRGGDPCDDHVVIEVSDNGCGMDEEIQRKVFEPFFSTKAPGRGTGLGLFVTYNLVEGLGGSIEVESKPGKGSTFRVILNALHQKSRERR